MPASFTALLHLLEMTRSFQPDSREGMAPKTPSRSYAPWSREERRLLSELDEIKIEAMPDEDEAAAAERRDQKVAKLLERTAYALSMQRQQLTEQKQISVLKNLPETALPLTPEDLQLLGKWEEPLVADPLGWGFGEPVNLPKGHKHPTLVLVTVGEGSVVMPVLQQKSSNENKALDYAASLQRLEHLSQATWVDLATKVAAEGGLALYGPELRKEVLRDSR